MLSACAYSDMSWHRTPLNLSRVEAVLKACLHKHLLAAGLVYNAWNRVRLDAYKLPAPLGLPPAHDRLPHTPLLQRATEPPFASRLHPGLLNEQLPSAEVVIRLEAANCQ